MYSIVLDNVHKVFRSGFFGAGHVETYALRGVTLTVLPGEVVSLLGPNGSGKSTTLKLISTILLPDRGAVIVNGHNTANGAQSVRRCVGYALASERSFFPRLTVRENLMFFATLEDVAWGERRIRANEVVLQAGLEDHADKQVIKLSSGMHQRLGIARALLKHPRVLLLDEPSRSLDPAAASCLWDLMRDLADQGMTVLLATHNLAEAVAVSDRVAVLRKGELLANWKASNFSVDDLGRRYREITEFNTNDDRNVEVPA